MVSSPYDIPDAVICSFSWTPLNPKSGDTVHFTDTSTNTAANGNITYAWDFGDGSVISTAQNPTHVYTAVGNGMDFTIMHTARGSVNQTSAIAYGTIGVDGVAPPLVCNSAGGDVTGVVASYIPGESGTDHYYRIWTNAPYPNSLCKQPYECTCSPDYAKYQCAPNGSMTLISQNHPDCCKFCGLAAISGAATVVLQLPKFTVTRVSVTPSTTCYSGEYIQAVATVTNTGAVAGAASVTFYWDDGTAFDLARTTSIVSVNGTQDTPPAGGFAKQGVLCAVVHE